MSSSRTFTSDEDDEISDPASKSNKKKKIFLFLCISTTCGLVIISIGLLAFVFTEIFGNISYAKRNITQPEWHQTQKRNLLPKGPQTVIGKRVLSRFYMPGDKKRMIHMSEENALAFCEIRDRRLPIPMSEEEEWMLIQDVKLFHELAECDYYLIGYKLDRNMRYMKLNEKLIWPSLKKSKAASEEIFDRDCIKIELRSNGYFKVIDRKSCNDINDFNCMIGFRQMLPLCENDIWGIGCLIWSSVLGSNLEKALQYLKSSMDNVMGVVLLDAEMIPLRILARFSVPVSCWLFDVKYVLNYLDMYDSNLAAYKVNVTIFQDPERDCIALNSKKDFQIETVFCEDGGCPLCEYPHQTTDK